MTNTHKVKLYWSIGFIVFVGSILLGIFGYVFGAVTMSLYLYMAYKVGTLLYCNNHWWFRWCIYGIYFIW